MIEPVNICVPGFPCSVNDLYERGHDGRVHLTVAGRQYQDWVALHARKAMGRRAPFDGRCAVAIRWYFGATELDIDNGIKATLDALQVKVGRGRRGGGVFKNDRQVRELHVFANTDLARPRVEVDVLAEKAEKAA